MSGANAAALLSESWLAHALARQGHWGTPLVVTSATGSTNDDAKRAAALGAEDGAVFATDRQHAGRGQRGRAWEAAPGSSLLFSCVFRPRLPAAVLPPLSLVVGLVVAEQVARWAPADDVLVKWPNDVYARGRKLAGILVEAQIAGMEVTSCVVGVGLNVTEAAISPEVAAHAVSLRELAVSAPREELLADLLWGLRAAVRRYEREGLGSFLPALRERDAARGRIVLVDGEPAEACGLDQEGRLLVKRGRETRAVTSGDVVFAPVSR